MHEASGCMKVSLPNFAQITDQNSAMKSEAAMQHAPQLARYSCCGAPANTARLLASDGGVELLCNNLRLGIVLTLTPHIYSPAAAHQDIGTGCRCTPSGPLDHSLYNKPQDTTRSAA